MANKRYLIILIKYGDDRLVDLSRVEPVFNENSDDWLRFNAKTWVVWTDKTAVDWYNLLRPFITKKDELFIFGLDPSERYGWGEKMVWDWFDRKRT